MTSKVTAVLELWPSGHSSPKHQHGGCAGSVRLVHGKLRMKLYKTLQSEEAMQIPGQQTSEVVSSSLHLNDSPSNPEPSLRSLLPGNKNPKDRKVAGQTSCRHRGVIAADVQGHKLQSDPQNLEKNKHFGVEIHDPKARTSMT